MNRVFAIFGSLIFFFQLNTAFAGPFTAIDTQAKLQRGAAFFMNYCSGCHSLQYMRYNRMAKDLGLMTHQGQVDNDLVSNLIFTSAKMTDPIKISMPKTDAVNWFGVMPPDLSLSARGRGTTWIYRFLNGFYADKTRPFGVNNHVVADTAMPDVLYPLKNLNKKSYERNLDDLLTFLAYVGEPAKLQRYQKGWVSLNFSWFFLHSWLFS